MAENNVIAVDFGSVLEIRINNFVPIELTDLTMSLLGIGNQYTSFIEAEANADFEVATELYVKEVRSGSIVIELITNTMPLVPLLWTGGSMLEWVEYSKSTIEWLTSSRSDPPRAINKQTLKQWNNILEPVAKDGSSQMNISAKEGNVTVNQIIINSSDAVKAQEKIRYELEKFDEPDDNTHIMKVMTWYQTKFDLNSNTGDRAIIEQISKKPLKVVFENQAVKTAILEGNEEFDKPWHELAYLVDVVVQTVRDVPKVYTVIRVHSEHTFDPASDV